jgi:hypothetical protein
MSCLADDRIPAFIAADLGGGKGGGGHRPGLEAREGVRPAPGFSHAPLPHRSVVICA